MPTDYIMRMIEEFGRGLARVLHLKDINQYENALDELNNLTKKMVGFDLKQIKMFGIDGIKSMFDLTNSTNVKKIYYCIKLLKESALIYFEQNMMDEGKRDGLLAIELYDLIKDKELENYIDIEKDLDLIKDKIN